MISCLAGSPLLISYAYLSEMPQFQLIVTATFIAALATNWFVFSNSAFRASFPFSIGFLVAAAGAVYWTFFTESGKKFAQKYNKAQEDKAEAQRQLLEKTKVEFERDLKAIEQGKDVLASDPSIEARLISNLMREVVVGGITMPYFGALSRAEKLFSLQLLLSTFPTNSDLYDFSVSQIYKRCFPSKQAYSLALDSLEASSGQPRLKQFALEIGRWHFGQSRKGKKVTIYDEQAIQNDIQARLG